MAFLVWGGVWKLETGGEVGGCWLGGAGGWGKGGCDRVRGGAGVWRGVLSELILSHHTPWLLALGSYDT